VDTAENLLLAILVQSATFKVLTKMATAIVTLKIMPEGPDHDLNFIKDKCIELIKSFSGQEAETKSEEKPIAFGLKALEIIFTMDEAKGSTDNLEKQITDLEGVQSVEVSDVRRAIG
jgi:elongation factor 1-beta